MLLSNQTIERLNLMVLNILVYWYKSTNTDAESDATGLQHRRHRRFLSTWEPKEKWRRDVWRPCQQLLKLSRLGVTGKGNVSDLVLAL